MTLSVWTGKNEKEELGIESKDELSNNPCLTRRANVYTAQIDIPFIERPTVSCCYTYDEVLELVFIDSLAVKSLKGYIDGVAVPINEYIYPSNPNMKAFYVELVGKVQSGTVVEFKLEVEWNDDYDRKKHEQKYTDGAQVIE